MNNYIKRVIVFSLFSIQLFADGNINKDDINVFGSLVLKDKCFGSISCVGKAKLADISADYINIIGPMDAQNIIVDNFVVVGNVVGEKIKGRSFFITGKADLLECSFESLSIVGNSRIKNSFFQEASISGVALVEDSILHNVTVTANEFTLINSSIKENLIFYKPFMQKKEITLILEDSTIEGQIEVEEGCTLSIIKKQKSDAQISIVSFDQKKESFFSWIGSFFR